MIGAATTLFDKLWTSHSVLTRDDGWTLLYIDRILLHEGSRHAFEMLDRTERVVRRPAQCVGVADHFVPTRRQGVGLETIENEVIRSLLQVQVRYSHRAGIRLFGLGDPDQGIVHVVGPEQGLTQPGLTIICGDSHTTTHGAMGAFAFGVGNSELMHALATQPLWRRKPRTMRILVDVPLPGAVTAKDLALVMIGKIGSAGASEHVIEFAGPGIRALAMDGRFTLCNMAIEAGAQAAVVAPDDATFDYLRGRAYAPTAADWDRAMNLWSRLVTDPGASFDVDVEVEADQLQPMVTWGTNPEHAVGVGGQIPDPEEETDGARRRHQRRALEYMGLRPGQHIADVPIDRVFIGSCTNARIDDLRHAARVIRGRKAMIPAWVVPGSGNVRRQAEREGLARIFIDAGFEWRESGCSMCIGMNGDSLRPAERCASTSNRNFEGRQGRKGRTHLVSPATAAATALHGHIVDIRELGLSDIE